MKSHILLLITACWLFAFSAFAQVAETEPNNSFETADTIPIRSIKTASVDSKIINGVAVDPSDFFKAIFPTDGTLKIYIKVTANNGGYLYLSAFDNRKGNGRIYANYVQDVDTITFYGRAADTCYFLFQSSGAWNYNFSYDVIDVSESDLESNNNFEEASTINQQQEKNGHIGYLKTQVNLPGGSDQADFYKTYLPEDGTLKIYVKGTNNSGVPGYLYLNAFDSRKGSGLLYANYVQNIYDGSYIKNIYDTITIYGRAADTFYFQLQSYGAWSYSLSYNIIDTSENDTAANETFEEALNISPQKENKGHIGYLKTTINEVGGRDTYDFYKTSFSLLKGDSLTIYVKGTNNSGVPGYLYLKAFDFRKNEGQIFANYVQNIYDGKYIKNIYDTITIHADTTGLYYILFESYGAWSYSLSYFPTGITPTKENQTITFDPIPNRTYGDAPFVVRAVASSGLPVTFSIVSGDASIRGDTVVIGGAGVVTVRAYQAGNNNYNAAFADISFTVYSPSADLIVGTIQVPAEGFAGKSIKVSWKVRNIGKSAITSISWTDRVYVSANSVFSSGSSLAQFDFVNNADLLPDSAYVRMEDILLPQNISGTYYIYVFADAAKQLTEYNAGGEDNNVLISAPLHVLLKRPPDLIITQLTVPLKASAGQKADIEWIVKNQGDTSINVSNWSDKFYLSTSPSFNVNNAVAWAEYSHSGGLQGNGEYSNSVPASVPSVSVGNYYVYLITDAANNVAEYDENNNIIRSNDPVSIGVPDLAVSNVSISGSVNEGQTLKVKWDIRNKGTGAAETGSLAERIFLSPLDTYTPDNAIWFDVTFPAQTVDANESLSREVDLRMPDIVSGRYYAFVYTDFTNTVYEDTSNYNNISRSSTFSDISTGHPVDDIGISEILNLKSDCGLSGNETISVKISNYGNLFHTGFNVNYRVNNGPAITENVGTATLLPGSTLLYTFNAKANLSAIADYTIKAYTTSLNDAFSSNDTITNLVSHFPALKAPENLLPPGGLLNLSKPVIFSWSAVPNAASYDLFVSKAADTMPSTPAVANLTQINYSHSGSPLLYGASYKWMIVAKRNHCQTSSAVQTFTLRHLPDLVVDSIITPLNGATSESPFSFSWIIKNRGTGSANSKWYEYVYISESLTDRTSDVFINSFENVSSLDPGLSYTHPLYTFVIPQGYQGKYYIVIRTNASYSMEEAADTNNIKIIPIDITLIPSPDLQVDSLKVSPTTVFSEDILDVAWTVKNLGTGPTTTANWDDIVYLSTNEILDPRTALRLGVFSRNGALTVNGEYKKNEKFKLPKNIGGVYFIHVVTDAFDRVYEYVHNNNNVRTWDNLNIIMRPNPNLTINSVSASRDTVSNNQSISMQWITLNEGAAPANPYWNDNLRLTTDTANGYTSYINAGYYTQNNILQPLSACGTQQIVRLPNNLPEGKYFFYAVSDIYNQVFEDPGETDNVSEYSRPVYIVNPDLKPSSFQTPTAAKSGEDINVSWAVKNIGGGIYNSSWLDAVYISHDTILDHNDVQLTSVSTNLLLLPNNQYVKQQIITIPNGLSGAYYLIIATDDSNRVYEKNESNNLLRASINITLSPWPNLQVTSIQHPLTDTAGTNISFSYTVKNTGSAQVNNKSWRDVFYLSSSKNEADTSKIYLATVNNNEGLLDIGQSYTNYLSALIPGNISGPYYIIAITDQGDDIYEYTDENNKVISDSPVLISKMPNVDLRVVAGQIVADSLTPGQTAAVEWYGANAGITPSIITGWEDAIYLSNNLTLDASDRLLKTVKVNKLLQPATSYNQGATVTIPIDASGTAYFLVNIDRANEQNDNNRGNNTRALNIMVKDSGHVFDSGRATIITQPPPSDLVPVNFGAAAIGTSGQPFTLSYSIKNNGTGITNGGSWTDRVYLSTDYVLDIFDIPIGKFSHTGKLAPSAQYADTQQAFIPSNIQGNYVVILKTDGNDNVYERNAENNNLAFGSILVQPQQPCDLIVSAITLPVGIQIAGRTITVRYTLKNIGANPVAGYGRDAVYLSKDSTWDVNDVLLEITDLDYRELPPQSSLVRQLTKKLINVAAGYYYVIVRTDILNNLVEVNENNNILCSLSAMQVDVKPLAMNVPAADTLVNRELLYYRINIPATQEGETMSLTLGGDSASHAVNRLYLKYAEAPAANSYDFVSEIPFSDKQEIIVPELQAGTYYIMASGNDTAADYQNAVLLARIIPFQITKVDARKGGNTGAVTVKISGAKFDSATSFKLTGVNGTISPVKIYYTNSTHVFATFNLLNAALGLYNVVATKSNTDSTRLINGFEIEKGAGSTAGDNGTGPGSGTGFVCRIVNIGFEDQLETGIQYPSSTRPLRLVSITIAYANKGNVDIPAPTRFLTALKENIPLSFTAEGISSALSGAGSLSGNRFANLILDFTGSEGPPGILMPGASGYIKVYTVAPNNNTRSLNFFISK
jgi:hypothetical protein